MRLPTRRIVAGSALESSTSTCIRHDNAVRWKRNLSPRLLRKPPKVNERKAFSEPLRGIVPPMATPLRNRDELDVEGTERLVDRLLANGVAGIFLLGTTGEGPAISYRLRYELVERVCEQVAGRVPVMVAVSDPSLAESIDLATRAADVGATAIVAAPPYYFPMTTEEVSDYFTELAANSPLPLILYNMPTCTKISLAPETIQRCLQIDNIVGIKDSSGDLDYFDQLVTMANARADWTILVGPEHLVGETVARGGHGGVCGGANIHPRLFVDLYQAAADKNTKQVDLLQEQVLKLGEIYQVSGGASAIIKAVKCGLSLLGLTEAFVSEPFRVCTLTEVEHIRTRLNELGLPILDTTEQPAG